MSVQLRSWFQTVLDLEGSCPVADRTDGDLIRLFSASRNEPAFAELIRRHGPMVLATCRRILDRDAHSADDAFQATFLVLATKAAMVRPPERVGAWLHGVAVRVAKKARDANRKISASAPSDLDKVPATMIETDPDLPHVRAVIDDVLAGLPAKYRAPVVLCELEGLSRSQAAARLGWNEGTLSGRLARAKKLLAERLTRRGVSLPATGLTAGLLATPAGAIVPPQLAAATLQAAVLVAAGAATAEVASEPVALLARASSPAASTFKLLAAGLAGVALGLGGWAIASYLDSSPFPPPASKPVRLASAPAVNALDAKPPVPFRWVKTHTLRSHGPVTAVACGTDFIAVGDRDGLLSLFDAQTGQERELLLDGMIKRGPRPIDRLQVSPDGGWIYIVTDKGESVHQCQVKKEGRQFPSIGGMGNWLAFGASADGKHWLEILPESGHFLLAETGVPGRNTPAAGHFVHEQVVDFADADSAETVATLTGSRGWPVLRLWSTQQKQPLWEVNLWKDYGTIDVTGIAVSPGGKRVVVTSDEGGVWIFDAKTGKRLATADRVNHPVNHVAFSPDGKRLAVACAGGVARVIEVETGRELAELKGHEKGEKVTCVAFSSDGDILATGGTDKTVRVWQYTK